MIVGAYPKNVAVPTPGIIDLLIIGVWPVIASAPVKGIVNCAGNADTQLIVKITDGISGLVGLVPAA